MEIDLHRMTGTGWEAPPTTLLNCCEYDLRGGAFRLYANLGTRFSSSAKAAWRVSTLPSFMVTVIRLANQVASLSSSRP